MKKIVIAVLLIAIVGFVLFFNKGLNFLIKESIQTHGSLAVGSEVKVGKVVTDLGQGSLSISDFSIANPEGFSQDKAFQVKEIKAVVDFQKQVIESIVIDSPSILAEFKDLSKSNLNVLSEQVEKNSQQSAQQGDSNDAQSNNTESGSASAEQDSEKEPVITIKQLLINQANVRLVNEQLGERAFVLEKLEFVDLSGTPEQLAEQISEQLTQALSEQTKDVLKKELKDKAKQELKAKLKEKLGDLKSIFD